MTTDTSCIHCGAGIPANDICVCSCNRTPGVHVICLSCMARRTPVTATWLNPLSWERIQRMDDTVVSKLFGHVARGNA